MSMPRTPENPKEVKFAAGKSILFTATSTDASGEPVKESIGPYRVMHELDVESGIWVSCCLEGFFTLESESGASLYSANKTINQEILSLLTNGTFQKLPVAPAEIEEKWLEITKVGKNSETFGNPSDVNKLIGKQTKYEMSVPAALTLAA